MGIFNFLKSKKSQLAKETSAEKSKIDSVKKTNIADNAIDPATKTGITVKENDFSFTDERDDHVYKCINIGNQVWMAENLAYKASNGCWAYKNDLNNVATYGYLYDWETAKKACPKGWHLPSDEEWTKLTDYLGGENEAGGKLKSISGWKSPNTGATNESGFSALPGGERSHVNGIFSDIGYAGFWWSATESSSSHAWGRIMAFRDATIGRSSFFDDIGYSVRCVRDN